MGQDLVFSFGVERHVRWARFLVWGLWSRRLTEPPRPACDGYRVITEKGRSQTRPPKGSLRRGSCQPKAD